MEHYFNINAAGCSIRCKLYAEEKQELHSVILFAHGFGGHKDNKAAERFARHILEKNKNIGVVTFNWPCHGDDVRKKLRLEDCRTYLEQLAAFLRRKYREPALYAYATSFGGYLVLEYITEKGNPFEKIALRCPAVNMYEVLTAAIMTEENRRLLEKGQPALDGFDRKIEIDSRFLEDLKRADILQRSYRDWADGILILHGTEDEIVPIEASRAFAEKNGIAFEAVDGADHRFQNPKHMDAAVSRIAAFFGMR